MTTNIHQIIDSRSHIFKVLDDVRETLKIISLTKPEDMDTPKAIPMACTPLRPSDSLPYAKLLDERWHALLHGHIKQDLLGLSKK